MNFAEMDEEMNGNVKDIILITDPLKQNEEKTNN